MEDKKRRNGWWALAGVTAGSVLLLYVAAYLALVRAVPIYPGFHVPASEVDAEYSKDPSWRFHPFAESLFWPINQIDRKVRPAMWEVPAPVYDFE